MATVTIPPDVSGLRRHNGGTIPEETVIAVGPGNTNVTTYYRPFWRPVLAGTLFAMSVFVLSWYLMIGFHVGVNSDGIIDLGGGAALWLWVTSAVAYFVGGVIASSMTVGSMRSSWLKGAAIWGLSVPLALVLYSRLIESTVLIPSLVLPHIPLEAGGVIATGAAPVIRFAWAVFIGLAVGLIFSLIGSSAASCGCSSSDDVRA